MDYFAQRDWMYHRLLPNGRLNPIFIEGVKMFVNWAGKQTDYCNGSKIRCPCVKCKNVIYEDPEQAKIHLWSKGFVPMYQQWTSHGEPFVDLRPTTMTSTRPIDVPIPATHMNTFENLVYDAAGPSFHFEMNDPIPEPVPEPIEEPPNAEAQRFYDLLRAAQTPIHLGHEKLTELSIALRMMTIKTECNISQRAFNAYCDLLKDALPPNSFVPENYYQAKKILSKLGLNAQRIDCCRNGCMLFRDNVTTHCSFCGEDRYKVRKDNGKRRLKRIPVKRMIYLPLIPRLKRLFASMSSAPHMRWHHENQREPGVLCHPSDGEAWKSFDEKYPDFAAEPRNVRLGLCSDGFNPFGPTSKPYSCWPVIVTPYNLPPEMCMTTPYLFLTLIIPGPHNPKGKIDVYLQPLIEELQLLWEVGVQTYDVSKKQNFMLKAALMWTINDFPAYGMLSGWSTAGRLACPYCMEKTKSFRLANGGKITWFDCHRRFLARNHSWLRNKDAFKKG